MKILIIADDLSGAADCAVGATEFGLRAVVSFADGADTAGADVVSVDANTRGMGESEAASTQAAMLRELLKQRPPVLYKKIDSTLRGHFVAEIAAVADFAGTPILAPSFPAMGRTLKNGEVWVKDTPLKDTEVWKNAKIDGPSTLPEMLARHGFKPRVISVAQLRGDPAALNALLAAHVGETSAAIICDAETEDDMAAIARATAPFAARSFCVGSGGLMRHLPQAHEMKAGKAQKPVLAVIGSVSSVSRAQSQHMADTLGVPLYVVAPAILRDGDAHPQWEEIQRHLMALLPTGRGMVVTTEALSPDLSEGPRLAASMARLLAPGWEHLGGLILTGGETARAMLMDWGVSSLELSGEVEPGVPLSYTVGSRRIPVVTKAGAFGGEDCLTRAWRMIQPDDAA